MKRIFAAAAVCAALTGLFTGCSGTNYSYSDGYPGAYPGYDTGEIDRWTDGSYYDGRNSDVYREVEGSETGRGNRTEDAQQPDGEPDSGTAEDRAARDSDGMKTPATR